jgi:phosphoribosylformylglycinamidine synthase
MPSDPQVRALIPTGVGINCEAETAHALRLAGAVPETIHVGDLLARPEALAKSQILAFAGGFSFGDHLGAGRALANRLARRLGPALARYLADGGLVIGICNGFQTIVRLGLLPGTTPGATPRVSLAANQASDGYHDGWVSLIADPASPCVFTRGIDRLEAPARHGEGRLLCALETLEEIRVGHLCPLRYADPISGEPTSGFPANPNGSLDAIAGLCDPSGRVFGLMPHPEAFLYPENHPAWRRRASRGPHGDGLALFVNGVDAARGR